MYSFRKNKKFHIKNLWSKIFPIQKSKATKKFFTFKICCGHLFLKDKAGEKRDALLYCEVIECTIEHHLG